MSNVLWCNAMLIWQDEQDSLVLLGATEEGVISFQYDGWRFVSTGVHYDKTTFGPGAKALSVFYNADQPLISKWSV